MQSLYLLSISNESSEYTIRTQKSRQSKSGRVSNSSLARETELESEK